MGVYEWKSDATNVTPMTATGTLATKTFSFKKLPLPASMTADEICQQKSQMERRQTKETYMNRTYFIYQTGQISGPFTVHEILGKCLRNEIHLLSEQILFCPTSIRNSYGNTQKRKVWRTLSELRQTGHHQDLCTNLWPLET